MKKRQSLDLTVSKGQRMIEMLIAVIAVLANLMILFYDNTLLEYFCLISIFLLLAFSSLSMQVLNNRLFFVLFIYSLMSVLLSMVFNGGLGAAIIFMSILLALMLFGNILISLSAYRLIFFIAASMLSFFLVTIDFSWIHVSACYTFNGVRINSNTFGILALVNCYFWACYLNTFSGKRYITIPLEIGIMSVSAYYVYLTGCRSALAAMLFFVGLRLIFSKSFNYRRFRLAIYSMMMVNALLVITAIFLGDKMEEYSILGASLLTGRQDIWKTAIQLYSTSPWIGNGTKVVFKLSDYGSTTSGHNTIISMMYMLGTIPTLSFLIMLGKRLKGKQNNDYYRIAQFAFLSSLVLSFFESFYTDPKFFTLYLLLLLTPSNMVKRKC